MAFSENYRAQVTLLLRTIPFIAKEKAFALKGGTAINLFVRNLPRLSVDIDLTYLPVLDRTRSLGAIDKAMKRIEKRIKKAIKTAHVTQGQTDGYVTKLIVRERAVQITIEVTPVLRGCVYETEERPVSQDVEDTFGFAEMQVVSFEDLYAGKIVAALDRQHPRDLFDVRDLLANEGISDELRAAFVVYMLSHNRPMFEVLGSKQKDIAADFKNNFEGMTRTEVTLKELLAARVKLVDEIVNKMPDAHKPFLISFERGEPDWDLLALPKVDKLPAVKWRQQNLDKLSENRRIELVRELERVLGVEPKPAQLALLPDNKKPTKPRKKKQTAKQKK